MLKSLMLSLAIIFLFTPVLEAQVRGSVVGQGADSEDQGPSTGETLATAAVGILGQLGSQYLNKDDNKSLESKYDTVLKENKKLRSSCKADVLKKYPEISETGSASGAAGGGIAGALTGLVSSLASTKMGKDYSTLVPQYEAQNTALTKACKTTSSSSSSSNSSANKTRYNKAKSENTKLRKTCTSTQLKKYPTVKTTGTTNYYSWALKYESQNRSLKTACKSTSSSASSSPFSFSFPSQKTTTPAKTTPAPAKTTPAPTKAKPAPKPAEVKPKFSLPGLKLPSGSAVQGSLFDPKNFKED